jgi:hypothetical protein
MLSNELEQYIKLLEAICNVTLNCVIPFCNAETIDSPIQLLRLLVETDETLAKHLSAIILPHILVVYEKYHKDAMMAEDILGLITTIAQVP